MVQFTALLVASILAISNVSAAPLGARTSLVLRQGTQFITGPCGSDADCASGCCNARTALCAARFVAEENGGPGCGFGGGGAAPAPAPPAGGSGKPPGTQFITGPCGGDGDCASACCNARTGLCAARLVALEQGAGCGFNGTPAAAPAPPAPAPAPPAAAPPAQSGGSGKPPGTQFITGPCGGDGDCASGCCNSRTGLCAARLVAEENGGPGCGFGGAPVAAPAPPAAAPPAQSGGSGKPPGTQFITGPCGGDGDCASACCNARTGLCAARLVALEQGAGCGFNGTPATAPPAQSGSGKPPGTQFITGPCGGDGDCASGCCNARTGLCAARLVALEQGAGCGFTGGLRI